MSEIILDEKKFEAQIQTFEKYIIIDEVSMIDTELLYNFFK